MNKINMSKIKHKFESKLALDNNTIMVLNFFTIREKTNIIMISKFLLTKFIYTAPNNKFITN